MVAALRWSATSEQSAGDKASGALELLFMRFVAAVPVAAIAALVGIAAGVGLDADGFDVAVKTFVCLLAVVWAASEFDAAAFLHGLSRVFRRREA